MVQLSFDILGAISGGDFDDNKKHLLVVKLMQKNISFFQAAADAAGLFKQGKVSVKDAISIKALKFHDEIINSINSGSVDNVHLFSMFEATDSLENMWKAFSFFREQIFAIQRDDFCINDRKVKVFLGGDFHFLDDLRSPRVSSNIP